MSDWYLRTAGILNSFADDVFQLHQNEDKDQSRVGSQRERELSQCLDPEDLKPAYGLAEYAVFLVAVDHIRAIAKGLTPPILTFSPWASARCVLEACSLGYWLADTRVCHKERACRMLKYRFGDLKNALSLGNSTSNLPKNISTESDIWEKDQRDNFLAISKRFGFSSGEEVSKKLSSGMPGKTRLAKITFGADMEYKLLSGATHGQFHASQLSTKMLNSYYLDGSRDNTRHLSLEEAREIGDLVMEWFAKATWEVFKVHGWQMQRLAKVFEQAYDNMDIQPDHRFWRRDRLAMVRP